uniref:Peptidase_M1 domain-containing protein n=1 Tax=Angiostrongylus cantonensis TaxID=6313 RepID=A0A0K0D1X3_ANGCA
MRTLKEQSRVHYDISIKTYLPFYVQFPPSKNLTFDGRVVITIKVLKPVREVVLNMKNITLDPVKCSVITNGKTVEIERVIELEKLEKFRAKGNVKEDVRNRSGHSIRAHICSSNGALFRRAALQGELDERSCRYFKALVKLRYRLKGSAELEMEAGSDWKVSKFSTTPRMSSYLLAILVSEFGYIEKYTKTGVRFRVWSRPEAKNMTQYALDSGVRCLEFYEDYFGIKYPLKKQDMVALPDFSYGAMENWGLITYRY